MTLRVEIAVGYMLKVLKDRKKITEYKNEFNAIKHGDYKTFLSLIDGEIPPMVIYNNGRIKSEENNPNYDSDFEGLLKPGTCKYPLSGKIEIGSSTRGVIINFGSSTCDNIAEATTKRRNKTVQIDLDTRRIIQ